MEEIPGVRYRNTNYTVTEDGEVYSITHHKKWHKQLGKGRYYRVLIRIDDKSKFLLVHRMVAELYVDNPYNNNVVDHIDGNTLNNHKDNLRWVTTKINNNNKHRTSNRPRILVTCVEDLNYVKTDTTITNLLCDFPKFNFILYRRGIKVGNYMSLEDIYEQFGCPDVEIQLGELIRCPHHPLNFCRIIPCKWSAPAGQRTEKAYYRSFGHLIEMLDNDEII